MAMNKKLTSNAEIVIAGGEPAGMCQKGFQYIVGGTIYTVKDRFYSDNTEFRRLVTDQGTVEDVTLATVIKDLKSHGAQILADPSKKVAEAKAEEPEDGEESDDEE